MTNNTYHGIDQYTIDLVKYKSLNLIGNNGFSMDDRPDVEQELMTNLFDRIRNFDAKKSSKTTFIVKIVERCITNLIRVNSAQCRDWRQCQTSLNVILLADGAKVELIDMLDNDGKLINHDRESRCQCSTSLSHFLLRLNAADFLFLNCCLSVDFVFEFF